MLESFSMVFLKVIKQVLSLSEGFYGYKQLPWQDNEHGAPALSKELSVEEARSAISTWIEAFDESYFEVDRFCDFNYTFEGIEYDVYVLDLHLRDGKVWMDAVAVSREDIFPWVHVDVSHLRDRAIGGLLEFLGIQVKVPLMSLSLKRLDMQTDQPKDWMVLDDDLLLQLSEDMEKARFVDLFLCRAC